MTKSQIINHDAEKCSTYDRFIPSRKNFNFEFSYHSVMNCENPKKEVDIVDQDVNEWSVQNYGESLRKLINCDYSSYRILPITCSKKSTKVEQEIQWPVRPRQKPSIGTPYAVLDLPNFMNLYDRNVLDWGKSNYIAAALWDSVYLWNADNSVTVPVPSRISSAIRWHPDGSDIFIACPENVKVWDIEAAKVKFYIEKRHCNIFSCTITAVDWHPSGKVLANGCNFGSVVIQGNDRPNKVLCLGPGLYNYNTIITISFSPTGRYVAASSLNSFVNVWTFPDGVPYLRIGMGGSTRGMSWHPEKHSYLCLGDTTGRMCLWNISLRRLIARYDPPSEENGRLVAIYSVSFSPLSGELVTSHVIHNRNNVAGGESTMSQINVLSSFGRVVDRIDLQQDDQVMYLKWNPDGTQVATAGSDETLAIWNFTPASSKHEKKRNCTRRKPRMPSELIKFTENFRYAIR